MKHTEASASPQHSFPENEKTDVDAEGTETEHAAWPLAVSPARVTFTPQQPAESWKGRGSLPHADCFFLRTQQVITEQGKRCLGTVQSKEVLKFHHGVFASLRDKIKQD